MTSPRKKARPSAAEYDNLLDDYEFFESHRAEWALQGHAGEYALVRDNKADFFPTLKDAYDAGLSRFGRTAYFIRQVTEEREIHYVPFLLEEDIVAYP